MTKSTFKFKSIRYLMYLPKDFDEANKYPVLFHLHGAGGRGEDFSLFKDAPLIKILEGDKPSPLHNAIVVIPQCHADTWFNIFNDLLELAQHIHDLEYVDTTRFVGSGISMGGYGIYQVIMCLPELFTKGLVCCGGGMYWNSGRLAHVKWRIFHGEKDTAVYPEEAKRMYHRLKEACADVTLTIYPDCDHNCWDKTFYNKDNQKWIVEE